MTLCEPARVDPTTCAHRGGPPLDALAAYTGGVSDHRPAAAPAPSPPVRGGADRPLAAGVVLAGGSGSRFGAGINKAFLTLAHRSIASWSLLSMAAVDGIGPLVFVVRPEDRDHAEHTVARELGERRVEIIGGGATRQESELQALRHLADRIESGAVDTVLIHDAARPLVSRGLIATVLRTARRHGGALPGFHADDIAALAPSDGADRLAAEQPLGDLIRVQTPQGFRADALLEAYEAAARDGFAGTDTASCIERYTTTPVQWVRGEAENFKITFAQDLALATDVVRAHGLAPGR
nr:IspD/TarI family cytidylyltransferase [Helcobacillus sp. ACRRO]